MGGFFFDFEAIRTASSDRDAPRRLTGGERLVEACIHYDTDYCDVSGEIPWSAKLLEFHDVARDAGVYIVPSTAYAGGAISASRRVVVSSLLQYDSCPSHDDVGGFF